MKLRQLLSALALVALTAQGQGLKDAVGRYFLIGTALNVHQSNDSNALTNEVVKKHFNAIVAENCMKSEELQPREGKFEWTDADRFVSYGEKYHLTMTGHCLVWHSQAPRWFFTDKHGRDVSREVLIRRMQRHIATVVGRYRGKLRGWDVVNEAFNDDGTMRMTPFRRIIGPDYIEIAFKAAHEADPDAELYYNDFSMSNPAKRDSVCALVKRLKTRGCRIDAVGMQSHNGLDYPNLDYYERTIDSLAACGVKVMVTELDVNVLPNPAAFGGAEIAQSFAYDKALNPYTEALPDTTMQHLTERYMQLFCIYYRHRTQISRVTLWGVSDGQSWMNSFPVAGRTNYPLLFDRQYRAKPVVDEIIKLFD